jgi:hypothetical protein
MAFTLTQVRTGEQKNFSVREILEHLGDPINNEIIIHGESYRINNVQGVIGGAADQQIAAHGELIGKKYP